jgi:hypothetical protein
MVEIRMRFQRRFQLSLRHLLQIERHFDVRFCEVCIESSELLSLRRCDPDRKSKEKLDNGWLCSSASCDVHANMTWRRNVLMRPSTGICMSSDRGGKLWRWWNSHNSTCEVSTLACSRPGDKEIPEGKSDHLHVRVIAPTFWQQLVKCPRLQRLK